MTLVRFASQWLIEQSDLSNKYHRIRFFAKPECWYQKCRPLMVNPHAIVKDPKIVKFYTLSRPRLKLTISCS